jgi:hypothetical protein
MNKKIAIFFCVLFCKFSFAQQLVWTPQYIKESSNNIQITCDASFGNKGLQGYSPISDVYVHIGCITTSSVSNNDWKSVPFTWATTNVLANVANVGTDKWRFTINGGLRSFLIFSNPSERIIKIAILYRNGSGNRVLRNFDGSDMYVPVYDDGLHTRIDNPLRPQFLI